MTHPEAGREGGFRAAILACKFYLYPFLRMIMTKLILQQGNKVALCLFCLLMSHWTLAQSESPIDVTDLAGRQLHFEQVPQKIILGESRYLAALSILNQEDPLKNIVGMLADLKQVDYGSYQLYQQQFPQIDAIPLVGHTSVDSFSVENVIGLGADLAIFGIEGHGPSSRHVQLIEPLEKAGVQVVFIDFREKPIENTIKSITLLGRVLGRESQAQAFIDFYQQQLVKVTARLSNIDSMPQVFIHSRAGLHDHCCETMVRGMMAGLLDFVKAGNIAASHIPGHAGTYNLEYLLVNQPDIYIATAVGGSEAKDKGDPSSLPYIHMGAGVNKLRAQASFKYMLKENDLTVLTAVQSGQAYTIWHHFYNSPLNIVAIQVFAKWLYPETFSDLDPQTTMEVLFERFQAIPLDGVYWLALDTTGEGNG